MPLEEVEKLLSQYRNKEEEIDKIFRQRSQPNVTKESGQSGGRRARFLSLEETKQRNKALLQDLETVKGNLRSKAIFSPTEMQWERLCKRYQEEPSLPVTTWRCNLPVYV